MVPRLKNSDLEHPEKAVDAYLYLDDLADMHRTALIQRLYSSPEMAELMLAQMDHPEDTLKTKKTLYVNKVGGFYPDPTNDEIVEIKECRNDLSLKIKASQAGSTRQGNSTNALTEHTTKSHTTTTSPTMIQPSISHARHHQLQTVLQMSLKQVFCRHKLN